MQRAVVRPYIQAIEKLGGRVVDVQDTKKSHHKIYVAANNQSRFFICPGSPSDQKSVLNFMTHVRRWLREIEHGH